MKFTALLLSVLAAVVHTGADAVYKDLRITGCSDTDGEDMYGIDGEEFTHTDFIKEQQVYTLPAFADPMVCPGCYEQAVVNQGICKQNLGITTQNFHFPTEAKTPPQSSIYTKDEVTLGKKNTLICHMFGFYPPQLRVRWTKNNENVTEAVPLSQFYPSDDGTSKVFSSLSFTPDEGDIYTCSVEHMALQQPLTREWEVNVALPSVGPSVFCGVGLVAGLIGVATGTFFLIKGNNCN